MNPDNGEMDALRREIFGEQLHCKCQQELLGINGLKDGKEAEAAEAKASGDLFGYLNCHDKRHWPAVLESLIAETSPEEWAKAVRDAWIYSDEIWINKGKWKSILTRAKELRGLMSDVEVSKFEQLADPLTIYRGCNERNTEGMSWSLDPNWAKAVARAGAVGQEADRVVRGLARKVDVLAYFEEHGEEQEVIIFPEFVDQVEVIERL